ncbi:hypothetical protein [Lactiplantibacillus plantarum]|uniref:hypothetical protein n=1 Tax=Lactiplantibacillus plantarum TaxID=1590 RepID=UPI0022381F2E|nr:hypothetical protein [Lactiplantibacillus plantarum]MCW6172028.1 hypothetical protein [Lactiplantibacillus plantarum]
MKQDKPVLKVEAEMQNLEQVKELLPQIATLQRKYTVDLKINMYPCTSNPFDYLADHLRSKESEISGKTTDTRRKD